MIIAFAGKAGSGKSTAIETLKKRGKPVCVLKFAGPLYAIQSYIYNLISPVYAAPEGLVKNRQLLQYLGTEFGRNTIRESLWVDLFKFQADRLLARDKDLILVSDDCRFDNEAEMVRYMGGVVVHVVREDATAHAEGGTGIEGHPSEAGIKPELIDYTVHNTGNLSEYQESLKQLFDRIDADMAAESVS